MIWIIKHYLSKVFNIPYEYYMVAIVILAVMLVLTRKRENGRLALSFITAYMFILLSMAVFSRRNQGFIDYSFIPFRSYYDMINGYNWMTYVPQITANIMIFIPIGILMQAAFSIRKITVLTGIGFSLLIEFLQLILCRGVFELDDIIHNTLGTVIGYGIYLLFAKIKASVPYGK